MSSHSSHQLAVTYYIPSIMCFNSASICESLTPTCVSCASSDNLLERKHDHTTAAFKPKALPLIVKIVLKHCQVIKLRSRVPAALVSSLPSNLRSSVPGPDVFISQLLPTGHKMVKYLQEPCKNLSTSRLSKNLLWTWMVDIWTTKSIQRSEIYLNLPGQISVELEISVRPDLMCGCGCNSAWIELLPCEHCPPRACSGNWPRLSSGQFIAMLRLHLPLELPIRPQFIAAVFWLIHCHGPAAAIVTLPHGCGTASCISNICD